MKGTWADSESALEHAREQLAERYPGEKIEIIECFDIGYVAWECDYMGALITRDGVPEIVIIDETSGDGRPMAVRLRERIDEYRKLIVDTERVLRRHADLLLAHVYLELDKLDRPSTPDEILSHISDVPPEPGDEMPAEIADAIEHRVRVLDDGMPPHMIALFEQLADTPYDLAAVDTAARAYADAVKQAGGEYGHALAGVWRAWHREKGGGE